MTTKTTASQPARHLGPILLLMAGALVLSGCFTTSNRMHGLAHDLDVALPDTELEHEFGLTLGRLSLGLGKSIARMIDGGDDDLDEAFDILRGVRRVEIATYKTVGDGSTSFPRRLEDSFGGRGWQTLARFRDGDSHGWVLCRIQGERLRNVMVLNLEDDELTMVRLGGRLEKVVSAAIAFSREETMRETTDEHDDYDDFGSGSSR